jgi:hypothetical protein
VQSPIAVLGLLERSFDIWLFKKLVGFDSLVDFDNILPDDTASSGV